MRTTLRNALAFTFLTALGVFSACSDDDGTEEAEGEATGSECPSGSDLTYDSFGRSFMASYCTRCHSSDVTGAARNEAPEGHDFDTLEGILASAEHIDQLAAAGPHATNTIMPPSDPAPSEAERRQLGEWLACEIAANGGGGGHGDGGAHD